MRRVTEGKQYRWIRELLDILEHAAGPEEFLENTKLEMFQDQVFCFTPKGDLIALPRGATPIDFAYAVHSQVGDRCVGAKIDGRMVQLRAQLQNGDQVEIITSRAARRRRSGSGSSSPARRGRASAAICACASATSIWRTAASLLTKAGASGAGGVTDKQLERVLEPLHQKSVDDLLAAVSDGALAPRTVLEALHPELKRTEPRKGELETPGDPAAAAAPPAQPDDPARRWPAWRRDRLPLCRLLPSGPGRSDRRPDPHRAAGQRPSRRMSAC